MGFTLVNLVPVYCLQQSKAALPLGSQILSQLLTSDGRYDQATAACWLSLTPPPTSWADVSLTVSAAHTGGEGDHVLPSGLEQHSPGTDRFLDDVI